MGRDYAMALVRRNKVDQFELVNPETLKKAGIDFTEDGSRPKSLYSLLDSRQYEGLPTSTAFSPDLARMYRQYTRDIGYGYGGVISVAALVRYDWTQPGSPVWNQPPRTRAQECAGFLQTLSRLPRFDATCKPADYALLYCFY